METDNLVSGLLRALPLGCLRIGFITEALSLDCFFMGFSYFLR